MPLFRGYKLALLVVIVLIAAWGRIRHIDAESLWVDEGFSYWAIRHDDMFGVIVRDVHPPLYFYALRAWSQAAGLSELALRYFSVLPSLLSVAAVVHVARELERGRGRARESLVPLLAALMLALADMENYVAQETRMYTWHVLWVILSMWGFLRWARTGERRALAGWFIATVLLFYTNYTGAATIAVQGLYALLFLRGRQRLQAIGTLLAAGLAFAPWALVLAGQTDNVGTGFNVPSTLESLWNWRVNWFTQQWALLGGLALIGLFTLVYDRSSGRLAAVRWRPVAPSFLMLAWLIVPVTGAYILNHYTPILMDYRLTQITPAVALLIAFGLGNVRQPALAFLVAVIVVYGVVIDDTPRPRPPWREVGQNAARYAVSGDLAMAHITPSGDWQVIYYFDRLMPDGVERRSLRQWQLEDPDSYPTGLPALLADHPHVWFMHWSVDQSGFEALAATGHVQTAVMTEDWLGNDLNVYRFDVVPPPEAQIAAYESGMILRDAVIHADALRVDLWWSSEAALPADYTVSALLLDAGGRLVAQLDSYPFNGDRPTTTWQPGEVVYDPRPLRLVDGVTSLPPGEYTVAVKVYQWSPEAITIIRTITGDEYAVIGTLQR